MGARRMSGRESRSSSAVSVFRELDGEQVDWLIEEEYRSDCFILSVINGHVLSLPSDQLVHI
jgi:hypothetical protein